MDRSTRVWIGIAVILTLTQALASAILKPGLVLTTISDFALALLLLALIVAFAKNAIPARGRLRAFWIMQSVGWFMLLIDQLLWMLYDLVLQKPLPTLFVGDVLLFLPGVMMLAGFLLQPHLEQSKRRARLGTLDFLLLMVWWVFFYVYLVTCWQYISPNEALYNTNYDHLYMIEILVVVVVQCALLKRSTGVWRRFYAFYLCAVLFGYFCFALENRAIELKTYFNGSWYDIAYVAILRSLHDGCPSRTGSGALPRHQRPRKTRFVAGRHRNSCGPITASHRPYGGTGRRCAGRDYALQSAGHGGGHVCYGSLGLYEAETAACGIEACQ